MSSEVEESCATNYFEDYSCDFVKRKEDIGRKEKDLQTKVDGTCPECCDNVNIKNIISEKKGWANKLSFSCQTCKWCKFIFTSKEVEALGESGQKGYDVNLRSTMAFRETGLGHEAMTKFSMVMNLSEPINDNAYNKINKKLMDAYSKVAADSMLNAASLFVDRNN
nr:uncharacterized protein LOC124810356 isoform X2 [Hydra vulgaris]